MEAHNRWKFADVVIDLNELVALVGNRAYLRDGREIGVGEKAADALRKAIPSYPEPPQGTRGTAAGNLPGLVRKKNTTILTEKSRTKQ